MPLISICIPAYKHAQYLERLLGSIAVQGFRDFEVIVTDDSPDEEVNQVCEQFAKKFPLQYYKNPAPLGTPENWNAAMRLANGEWIKLMHDDDWFRDENSLAGFADATEKGANFIFSAYENHELEKGTTRIVHADSSRLKQLTIDPVTLFSSNVVGPPSVVMHRNDRKFYYDRNVRWVVDIEFYIRYLARGKYFYINKPLVNVGIGSAQVTMDCFRQRAVEIPEAFYLLEKTGQEHLKHILVYDGWWRLLRNLEVRSEQDIRESGYSGEIPPVLQSMIRWQRRFPLKALKFGPLSKSLMFLHYISHKKMLS